MHQFASTLFKQLDNGRPVDNLYMLNGHFADTIKPLFTKDSSSMFERMQISFNRDIERLQLVKFVPTLNALDHIGIAFNSEWPLEIVLDQDMIMNKYNLVFRFLMKIKRVSYVLQLRDYWLSGKDL